MFPTETGCEVEVEVRVMEGIMICDFDLDSCSTAGSRICFGGNLALLIRLSRYGPGLGVTFVLIKIEQSFNRLQ